MTKFIILENHSADAGRYGSFKDIRYGGVVEGEYVNEKQDSIYVLGSEFNKIGATIDQPELKHMYGDFTEVEE
ncbi:hypothetical protein NVP1187O_196 [Vibrio phage 1.187.O._10N.286.49.F1]|nr:hypothetical protein NVP1187O_196 [Vibrio phage 1.187.O._10N.286.49.F1]